MDAKEFRNELRRDININLYCNNINVDEFTISEKIDSYTKLFIENVSLDSLESLIGKIENIELKKYFFEITFSICFIFKNNLILQDTIHILADRK